MKDWAFLARKRYSLEPNEILLQDRIRNTTIETIRS